MNAQTKLLNDCYDKIIAATILTNPEYLPALHKSAELLRASVQQTDNVRRHGFVKILTSTEGQIAAVKFSSINEVYSKLQSGGLSSGEKARLEGALAELINSLNNGFEGFKKNSFEIIRKFRDGRYEISESKVKEALNKALVDKRRELDRIAVWLNENVAPLIKELGAELASVDNSIKELADKNIFEQAVALLPEFEESDKGGDEKKSAAGAEFPEAAVIKYSIQVTRECLNILSTGYRIGELLDKRIDLSRKRDALQALFDEGFAQHQKVERHIFELSELSGFMEKVGLYFNETSQLEDTLVDFSKRLNQIESKDFLSGKYNALLLEIYNYLNGLDLIYR